VEPLNATSFNEWADLGTAPALPESQKLYNKLLSLGIKIVFLTERANKQRNITAKNLRLAGLPYMGETNLQVSVLGFV
jgi:predicted secreted acid phosphatase